MNYSTGLGLPYTGKTFKVRDICRWAALIQDCNGEESQLVAFIILFVNFLE